MNLSSFTGAIISVGSAFNSGLQSTLVGMYATGGRVIQNLSSDNASQLRSNLSIWTAGITVEGVTKITKGVKELNTSEIINGSIQAIAGGVGLGVIASLDSNIMNIASDAIKLAFVSTYFTVMGIQDLTKRRWVSGACKILTGIGGTVGAGFYVYKSLYPREVELIFLNSQKTEIEQLYESKWLIGGWKYLGYGASKITFTHPSLPGKVLKIPREGLRTGNGDDDLMLHYKNLEELRGLASHYDRIVLPEAYFFPISNGLALVEEKLNLASYGGGNMLTSFQFENFVKESKLCDLVPTYPHNAGMIIGSYPPKIGIIDFDCRK